ncbi:MAG: transglycosylase domain-containing protein [Firmicutes bacterium]|nr:transglycosylase domain-containing protein [Bacillota bacterium]
MEPMVKIYGFERLDAGKLSKIQRTLSVYDGEGLPVSGDLIMDNKIYVPLSGIPKYTADAFISIEDTRFYQHVGTDYYRIAGAGVSNLKSHSFKEGASTITQQLVKNTHLSGEKKMRRKINEMRIAVDLERRYTKNEILEMYLNVIYFGSNVYGIGAAAKAYFNKPASELTLNESAILAAVINNPSNYNLVVNPEKANERRRLVLAQMRKFKRISATEYEENAPVDIYIEDVFFDQYANFLVAEACEVLDLTKNEFFSRGYKISTYLDRTLQKKINRLLLDCRFENKNGFKSREDAIIAVVVMTAEGDIIANAGGGNRDLSGVYRQPGSLIKPAISFAPALEKGLIVPVTPILDESVAFDGYAPKNYKDRNLGWVSATVALKHSQNIPAVKLTDMCGIEYSKGVAEKLGYKFEKGDDHLALALGGMKKGAKLTQIAGSYQAFANGGEFIRGAHVTAIRDGDGTLVYKRERAARRAVSEETAYFINEMLSECATDGTAKRIGKGYAAKTGTVGNNEGNSDAYVVVYDGSYIVAVWIGAKYGLMPNTVNGATYPCVIAKKVLELLPAGAKLKKPDSIIAVDLDKDEYYKNHKLVAAPRAAYKKDKINANFSIQSMPKERALDNNFILKMNDIDFDNFIIVDEKFFNNGIL